MLVIGVLGLLTFVGGSIFWHVQLMVTQRRTMLKEQAEAEARFLGLKVKAEQGDDQAQLHLGFGYMQGQGVKQNLPEAVKWIRKAAVQNNAYAQSILGNNYANGYGVVTNLVEAYAWYNLAATTYTGLAGARNALAMGMSPEQIAAGQKLTRNCVVKSKPSSRPKPRSAALRLKTGWAISITLARAW